MEKAKARRRWLALTALAVLALGGFAVGSIVGGGSGDSSGGGGSPAGEPRARPTLAETLRPGELAGERIVVGIDGTGLTAELRGAVRAGKIAGVVLFEADFPTRAAGRRLIDELQAIPRPPKLARLPLLVMTDQEGGEVKRVDGPPQAAAAAIGREGPAYARRQGRLTAANLESLGVDVDLAPVLDVARPGGVIAATERGFGATAAVVTETAVPFAEGLQAGGVAATAKHFPGLGTASENTDFEAQDLTLSKAELRAVDEAPYRAYIAAGGKLLMLDTAVYPAFSSRPAAFSRRIATGELRGGLGFRGVTITDSLGSSAVAAFGGQREAAVDGAAAGDDLLLFDDLPSALEGQAALVAQLHRGGLRRAPFLAAVGRVSRLRTELARGGPLG
ncbi:MAG TPA: glycoside hydrolase family 3 N-terminal domain-containing protein [Solirubrobacterales bacterium]|nr:glycoside hydrolase family 3 N-terminal domain-containing protein [Solirubrobacterales bacterium]